MENIVKYTKQSVVKNKLLLVSCVAAITLNSFPIVSNAKSSDEEIKKGVMNTTYLVEDAIKHSYELAEQSVKEKIVEEKLDYTLTMESFYEQENPYANANYLELIAAYLVAKEHVDTLKTADMYSLPFIQVSISKNTITEYEPLLVDSYIEDNEQAGVFDKEKPTYIYEPMSMPQYQSDGKGRYIENGFREYEPKRINTEYGEVQLSGITAEDIFAIYGIEDNEDIKEAYEKKVNLFSNSISNQGLAASVFIQTARSDLITPEQQTYIDQLLNSDLSQDRKDLISTAVSLVGKVPYEWGGKATKAGYDNTWWSVQENGNQKGLDCSGFVQWAFLSKQIRSNLDIISSLQSTSTTLKQTKPITESELQPGDLGLINNGSDINHIGIYLGDGNWVHCSSAANTVVIAQTDMFKIYRQMPTEQLINQNTEETKQEVLQDTETYVPEQVTTSDELDDIEEYHTSSPYTEEEIYLLAQLVYNEANSEGINGWIAVAEVVRNRVESELFPNTIREVIYQDNPTQFSDNYKIETRSPSEEQVNVVRDVLADNLGVLNNRNILYFRNTNGSTADWGSLPYYDTINHHQFYLKL